MKKLKIVSSPVDRGGCGHYRVRQPLDILEQEGLALTYIIDKEDKSEEIAMAIMEADIILMRPRAEYLMWYIKEKHPKCKAKFVMDTDDNTFEVDPYSDHYRSFGLKEVKHKDKWLWKDGESGFSIKENEEHLKRYEVGLEDVDLITTTQDKLSNVFKKYNPNVASLPNAINFNTWKKLDINKDKKVRITWGGGASHYRDLWSIQDIWSPLIKKYKDLKFIACGTLFRGALKAWDEKNMEEHKWVHVEAHPYKQASLNADIGICPLDTKLGFNEYKSEIKWLEYSSLKIPCVVSDLYPYSNVIVHGVTGFIAKNKFEWRKYLSQLIENQDLRKAIGQNAYDWAKENRDITKVVQTYADTYRSLIGESK
jgi:glycosyltransferase involved in cell wall biosynthesis